MTFLEPRDAAPTPPLKSVRLVWLAVVVGLVLRLIVLVAFRHQGINVAIEKIYLATTACLASGQGMLAPTGEAAKNNQGFDAPVDYVEFMKARQQEGGRVDAQHLFPRSTVGWRPSTLHPPAYSLLLWFFYELVNYNGMVIAVFLLQIIADASGCALVYILARNLFDERVGVIAAWVFALMPAAILQSASFLPDAFHCFFTAAILATATLARKDRPWFLIPTGLLVGLASLFRTEYLTWALPLFLIVSISRGRLLSTMAWTAGLVAAMLVVLLPWVLWTRTAIGKPILATTGGGPQLYVALGEDVDNPWGIKCDEPWLEEDSRRRGFSSYMTPEADREYRRLFLDYVRQYPLRFARTVLTQRLPLALATPYLAPGLRDTADQFSFGKYHLEEGLSRWGVLRKYPLKVLRFYWPPMAMAAISGLLTLALLGVCIVRWREIRKTVWLLIPWGYTVTTICLIKQIEPRNLAPVLVVQSVAAAIVLRTLARRRRGDIESSKRPAHTAPGAVSS